jgi:type IV secretory pathway TrbF-like protein
MEEVRNKYLINMGCMKVVHKAISMLYKATDERFCLWVIWKDQLGDSTTYSLMYLSN